MRTGGWIGVTLSSLAFGSAVAQAQVDEAAAADAAARAALPRAEIRRILVETRLIAGLSGGVGAGERNITGDVAAIAVAQRGLEQGGLSTQLVNGALQVSLPGDVLFDFDKASIRPSAIPILEKVKAAAQLTGDRPVSVAGYTDALGTPAHNQPLSEARARSVAGWLAAAGIAQTRVSSAGFGASKPVAPNKRPDGSDDPAGRQKNRRVTVTL